MSDRSSATVLQPSARPVDHPAVASGGIGVLLVNLGTPDACDAKSVRVYLREFLSDRRVIEDQGLVWKAILNGIVRDPAGEVVPNARVQVADHKRSANTGPDGRFTLRDLPSADTLHVIVARIGFRPEHLVLVLAAGENELTVEVEPVAQRLDAMRTEVLNGLRRVLEAAGVELVLGVEREAVVVFGVFEFDHAGEGEMDLGLVEGWNSVNTDPSDFSGHRLLADTWNPTRIYRRSLGLLLSGYWSSTITSFSGRA